MRPQALSIGWATAETNARLKVVARDSKVSDCRMFYGAR